MAGTRQKFLITSGIKIVDKDEIDALLNEGWRIISVTPRDVSTTKVGTTEHGGFGILLEKFFPDDNR